MSMRKRIIIIGFTLMGVLGVGLLTIAVMGMLQGEGAQPWKLVRDGRGGTVFPIATLPVFLAVIVLGYFWIRRRFFSSEKGAKGCRASNLTNKSNST